MTASLPLGTKRVPRAIRGIWLALFVAFATLGLFLLMMLLVDHHLQRDERALMSGFGSGMLLFAAFSLRRGKRMYYNGIWQYFFRPGIQLLCVQAILLSSSFLLFGHMYDGDKPPAIFFIVFPTILLFALTFFTGRGGPMTQAPAIPNVPPIPLPSTYPANDSFTVGGLVFGFGRLIFNVVGSIFLLLSLLMALAVATNLPGLFDSGVADPQFKRDMLEAFGTPNWPRIMLHIGAAISFVAAMIASGLLLVPRRHFGAAHMFRAIIGIGVLFLSIIALGRALPDWATVAEGSSPGIYFDNYLNSIHPPHIFLGGLLAMCGIFLLLWPSRKSTPVQQINYNIPITP